jgi:hypothetical protein
MLHSKSGATIPKVFQNLDAGAVQLFFFLTAPRAGSLDEVWMLLHHIIKGIHLKTINR